MTNTAKFTHGDKIYHQRFGRGRVIDVYALASSASEETEYTVRFVGDRYDSTIGEESLVRR